MSVLTLGDLLDRVQAFETRLEAYYADLRDRAERDGVRMLTYYLARHRKHLPSALKCLSESDIGRVRRSPCKYNGPAFEVARCFRGKELPSSTTAPELLDAAIGFAGILAEVYRWVAGRPQGGKESSLFQSLLKIEESHLVELKKIKAADYF